MANEKALDEEVVRAQHMVGLLTRGEIPVEWLQRFRARHGRAPTDTERAVRARWTTWTPVRVWVRRGSAAHHVLNACLSRVRPQVASALREESHALRLLRHEAAAAAVGVTDAERKLLLKEQAVASQALRQWEERQRKQSGALPTEEMREKSAGYHKIIQLIDGCEHGLKVIERRRRTAKEKEEAWPGTHWRRMSLSADAAELEC
jgi:hypothetical protein